MSKKLQWRRTVRGDYVCGKYLILRLPRPGTARTDWTLYDEGRVLIECDRLGAAKRYAQERADGGGL